MAAMVSALLVRKASDQVCSTRRMAFSSCGLAAAAALGAGGAVAQALRVKRQSAAGKRVWCIGCSLRALGPGDFLLGDLYRFSVRGVHGRRSLSWVHRWIEMGGTGSPP